MKPVGKSILITGASTAFLPLLGARENHPVRPGWIQNISSVNGQVAIPFMARLLPARTLDWLMGRMSGLTPTK